MHDDASSAIATARAARRPARWRAWLLVAGALAGGVAACGGSDDPAYCADRSALARSLRDLGEVDVRTGGVDALTDQLSVVQRDADELADSARDAFAPQASALRSATARLEGSVRATIADPTADRISTTVADASDVVTAFGDLSDAIGSRC